MEGWGTEESDGCGEDQEKGEGGYINSCHVDRGKPGIRSDRHKRKPQFISQAATNTRGQSVADKNGPPIWRGGSLPPFFPNEIRTIARFRILFAGVLMVYEERKTKRHCGYADGLEGSSTGGLKSTWNGTHASEFPSKPWSSACHTRTCCPPCPFSQV